MAHHIYTTDALVVEGTNSGEANKSFLLFTSELGMIRAHAQGVRLLKSKLRFSLQEYEHVSISVVRGKEMWRITSCRPLKSLFKQAELGDAEEKDMLITLARVCALIKRLMPHEEKHEKLFEYVISVFLYACHELLDTEDIKNFECIIVLNLLYELGYLGRIIELEEFIYAPLSGTLLKRLGSVRKIAYQEINRSLRETQL